MAIRTFLAVALLVGFATSADAHAISYRDGVDPGGGYFVDILLEADAPGLTWFSLAIVYVPFYLSFDAEASWTAPYVLFSPWEGKGTPSVYLVPEPSSLRPWPNPPPGYLQTNLSFIEPTLGETRATGLSIHLARLVFEPNFVGPPPIQLMLDIGSTGLRADGAFIPPSQLPTTYVPEAGGLLPLASGLVAMSGGVAWRRRAAIARRNGSTHP